MKKLKLKAMDLGAIEILTRDQMKNVFGAEGSGGSKSRCSNDRFCSIYHPGDGGCKEMQTGQCRCVIYSGGSASESVPDSHCLL